MINGHRKTAPTQRVAPSEFVLITERSGKRQLRLSSISQVIFDPGQIGGPWFVRCDGQQLGVTEANAKIIMGLLDLNMEDVKP